MDALLKSLTGGRHGIASADPGVVIAEAAPQFRPGISSAYAAFQVCNTRYFDGALPVPRIEAGRIQSWGLFGICRKPADTFQPLITLHDHVLLASEGDFQLVNDITWHETIHLKVLADYDSEAWRPGHGYGFRIIADRIAGAEGWPRCRAKKARRNNTALRHLQPRYWPHAHKASADPAYAEFIRLIKHRCGEMVAGELRQAEGKRRAELEHSARISPRLRGLLGAIERRVFDAGDIDGANMVARLWAEFENEKKELSVSVSGLCIGVRRQAGEEISRPGGLHVSGMVDEFSI